MPLIHNTAYSLRGDVSSVAGKIDALTEQIRGVVKEETSPKGSSKSITSVCLSAGGGRGSADHSCPPHTHTQINMLIGDKLREIQENVNSKAARRIAEKIQSVVDRQSKTSTFIFLVAMVTPSDAEVLPFYKGLIEHVISELDVEESEARTKVGVPTRVDRLVS